jgi:hypothetical protein
MLLLIMNNDSMAQWQRVGFQTRRLGVRFPLGSFFFFFFLEAKNIGFFSFYDFFFYVRCTLLGELVADHTGGPCRRTV